MLISLTQYSPVTLIWYIWMSTGTLKLDIKWHLSALAFKKVSENQSNILCIPFSSFSKMGIISDRQLCGVVSSAKLAYSKSLQLKKRSHI